MRGVRRSLLVGAMTAVLMVPASAGAAPSVAASAVPGVPQDCQAGCIGSLRLTCAATDPLSVQTTVRCWTRTYSVFSSTQDLPAAFVSANTYNAILGSYTLCVEGIARYRSGATASSGIRCSSGDDVGVAVVVG
jgi:hypothetical protein